MHLIAAILLTAMLAGQQPPTSGQQARDDPGGWNKAKWGMTDVELLAAFEGVARRLRGEPWSTKQAKVGIESWKVGNTNYHVLFIPDEQGRLRAVQVHPHTLPGPNPGSTTSPPVFHELNTLLVERYGQPDSLSDETQSDVRVVRHTWICKTTMIDLTHIY